MSITIENLSKNFGDYKALDNINLEVNSGELIALFRGRAMRVNSRFFDEAS